MLETEGTLRDLPMRVAHVQALCDGQFFLEHLDLVRDLSIEPYCRRCHLLGQDAHVAVRQHDDKFTFLCAHTSGWVKRTEPLEVQPLLGALGWDLRCVRCQQLVDATNGKADQNFLVTCPCTIRAMRNPLAAPHATATGLSAMGELGGSQ